MPTSKQPMMYLTGTNTTKAMQSNDLTKEDLDMEIAREMMLLQVKDEHDAVPIRINVSRLKARLEGEFFTAPIGLDREGILNFILTAGKSA